MGETPKITNASNNSTFEFLINSWLDYQRPDCTPATIRNNSNKAGKFQWWFLHSHQEAGDNPDNVTIAHAREFAAYLKTNVKDRWGIESTAKRPSKNILSPDSITSYGRAVKAFSNWLESENLIKSSPFNHKSVQFKRKHETNRILKTGELDDLAKIFTFFVEDKSFIGLRNLAIVALLLNSGIRRGELSSLKIKDLDLSNRRCKVTGKTGIRYAHFNAVCKEALVRYLSSPIMVGRGKDSALWLTVDGTPLAYETVQHIFRHIRKNTGVRVYPHALRHTFASMMAASGADAFALKELLGHESVLTTEQYVRLNKATLEARQQAGSPLNAVDKLTSIGGKRRGRPTKIFRTFA